MRVRTAPIRFPMPITPGMRWLAQRSTLHRPRRRASGRRCTGSSRASAVRKRRRCDASAGDSEALMWCRSTKQRRAAVRRRESCDELRVVPHIRRIDTNTEIVTGLSMVAYRLNRRALHRLGFDQAMNQDAMVRCSRVRFGNCGIILRLPSQVKRRSRLTGRLKNVCRNFRQVEAKA